MRSNEIGKTDMKSSSQENIIIGNEKETEGTKDKREEK